VTHHEHVATTDSVAVVQRAEDTYATPMSAGYHLATRHAATLTPADESAFGAAHGLWRGHAGQRVMRLVHASAVLIMLLSACDVHSENLDIINHRPTVDLVVVDSLYPSWADARVVSPSRILIRDTHQSDVTLVAHELCHVEQWQRIGGDYPLIYAWQYLLHGYDDMPLEQECRVRQNYPSFQRWASDLIEEAVSDD